MRRSADAHDLYEEGIALATDTNDLTVHTGSKDDPPEDQHTLDEMLWPLMPYFGARAATLQGGVVMFGSIAAVDQTVGQHEILYVLHYDDGDVEHLDQSATAAAVSLALASVQTQTYEDTEPPRPDLKEVKRRLQRRDACA